MMTDYVLDGFSEHLQLVDTVRSKMKADLEATVDILTRCFLSGKKVLVFGNGGSAADAQHFSAEFIGRFSKERKGMPCLSLATDTSALTAIANDFGYASIFSRQIEALAVPGDVLLGISTSGQSSNVLEGMTTPKAKKCKRIVLVGAGGGPLVELADIPLCVPSKNTARVQEIHILLLHLLVEGVELALTEPSL